MRLMFCPGPISKKGRRAIQYRQNWLCVLFNGRPLGRQETLPADRPDTSVGKTPRVDLPFQESLREIIYRILRGPEGARLRAIATLGDQSHRTAKAIAWVKANFAKPLRVEDLANIAGMGVSTLHHHFRALTAMSPLH